ncbi:hypothetical protein [Phyllobacterium trifolii]
MDPISYIDETLTAIMNGHPQTRSKKLMPWHSCTIQRPKS